MLDKIVCIFLSLLACEFVVVSLNLFLIRYCDANPGFRSDRSINRCKCKREKIIPKNKHSHEKRIIRWRMLSTSAPLDIEQNWRRCLLTLQKPTKNQKSKLSRFFYALLFVMLTLRTTWVQEQRRVSCMSSARIQVNSNPIWLNFLWWPSAMHVVALFLLSPLEKCAINIPLSASWSRK